MAHSDLYTFLKEEEKMQSPHQAKLSPVIRNDLTDIILAILQQQRTVIMWERYYMLSAAEVSRIIIRIFNLELTTNLVACVAVRLSNMHSRSVNVVTRQKCESSGVYRYTTAKKIVFTKIPVVFQIYYYYMDNSEKRRLLSILLGEASSSIHIQTKGDVLSHSVMKSLADYLAK